MPACIAHYQFGQEVLSHLDEKTRSFALTYQQEFDAGLQGPDIFFFYKPYRHTRIRAYGVARHNEPAVHMFAPILAQAREKAALSYLLGLICHYALDKCCHPYVNAHSSVRYDHQRMESAFDLHIMLTRHMTKPRFSYLPSGLMDFKAMASLWMGLDAPSLRKCINSERRAIRLLDHRKFLVTLETITGKLGALTPMTLPNDVSKTQAEHVTSLKALYKKALDECPFLIRTAMEFMGNKLNSGFGFDLNYKGIAANTDSAV